MSKWVHVIGAIRFKNDDVRGLHPRTAHKKTQDRMEALNKLFNHHPPEGQGEEGYPLMSHVNKTKQGIVATISGDLHISSIETVKEFINTCIRQAPLPVKDMTIFINDGKNELTINT